MCSFSAYLDRIYPETPISMPTNGDFPPHNPFSFAGHLRKPSKNPQNHAKLAALLYFHAPFLLH